ncbi:hypothetical protein [Streptomyces deccanensis]|uniref:hypothetical protein n=1 Tax=Streptomyces deccanensis TaxID=424188 RepID=UPI001EFB0415|nr:hypothetical protein [Streptomyces deccanensis]ULR55462.1 hypothetical protein L3078_42715 [Streptomyces deccanensis]
MSRWAAAAAVVGAVVVAVTAWRAAATAPDPGSQPDSATTTHETGQDPDQAREYWTPERMREADDAPMPKRD